jgi:hypothetical protein
MAGKMEMEMQIKMIEGLHLTATNKRHIADMITRGMMDASTKTISYIITNIEGTIARLTIIKRETDMRGRTVARRGHYVVEFK